MAFFFVELPSSVCYSPNGILDFLSVPGKDCGMFITFEGIEGSGKSLQIGRSEEHLNRRGIRCRLTREPGGTEFGIAVRQVLLRVGGAPRAPMSELLLYLADRHQHLKEVVEPALAEGIWVLSDRYHDATRAYQGAARGIPPDVIDDLAQLLGIPEPDGTLLLDLDPAVGLARARMRNAADSAAGAEGRFEAEELSFHEAVREAYLGIARGSPARIRVVNAAGTPEQVFSRIRPILDEWAACAHFR
jgi:dTMP kinase